MVTVVTAFELFYLCFVTVPAGPVSPAYPVLLNWPQHCMYLMYLLQLCTDLPTYEKFMRVIGGGGGGGMSSWVYIQIVYDYTYSFIVGICNV